MENSIKYEGEIDVGNLKLPCYVLENGTRILSARGMQVVLNMVDDEDRKQTAGTKLIRYLTQKSLKPFIFKDKDEGHFVHFRLASLASVIKLKLKGQHGNNAFL